MINDGFGMTWVDDTRIATGMYSNEFVVVDVDRAIHSRHRLKVKRESSMGLDSRCQSIDVHPTQNLVAIGARERLYFYQICESEPEE
jgi:hypothetical protein